MAYFPFFVELEGASGLVAGGGNVALRKVEKLLPYGPRLTVIAPRIDEKILAMPGVVCLRRAFEPGDLEGKDFAVAAAGDREVNHWISRLCRERKIPVNVVDDKEASSFLFPSLIKRGELSVGISTGGSSPSAAIYLKERFAEAVPENLPEILDFLAGERANIRQAVSCGERREMLMKELFWACMEQGGPLTREEVRRRMEKYREDEA